MAAKLTRVDYFLETTLRFGRRSKFLVLFYLICWVSFTVEQTQVNEEMDCGVSVQDRIIGGQNAYLGQWPWLARLGYKSKHGNITFDCGGVLISNQHVLTASHCIADIAPLTLFSVELGEYQTNTTEDCVKDHCADPVQSFKPVQIVIPTEYNEPPYKHDIAIVKLNATVKYSRWVKPICLPLKNDSNFNDSMIVGKYADVAGWGLVDSHTMEKAVILQTLKIQIKDIENCTKTYADFKLGREQLCAGGEKGKDSCSGDSGGPLMMPFSFRTRGPRYFAVGIVSLGPKACGEFGEPALYTNVTYYLPWILKNINE